MEFSKRYVILGFARQGRALARYLITHGARVTVSDRRTDVVDQEDVRALGVQFVMGGHPLALLDDCDVLCLSGGIPNDAPIVSEARRRGIALCNDAQVFFDVCPARMLIGISGSAGKTTTTTLVHGMLARHAHQPARNAAGKLTAQGRVWVGGNIGNPLIADVDAMAADDTVVMELSSFQLELIRSSPAIACITNITPNHLDRHASMDEYVAAKQRIVQFQTSMNWAVLCADDAIIRSSIHTSAHIAWFGLKDEPATDGAWLDDDGDLRLRLLGHACAMASSVVCNRRDLKVIGDHNVLNVLAASALAALAGAGLPAIRECATTFTGVPHRLELVRELNDVRWYNDSIATAPVRLMAGLHAFDQPVVLLVGGRDKHLPWDSAIKSMAKHCRHVIFFGELGPMVSRQFAVKNPRWSLVDGLRDAIQRAVEVAKPHDVVLLSPGGTSFDEFTDFAERGDVFKQAVNEL